MKNILITVCVVLISALPASAARFSWEGGEEFCTSSYTCGEYIFMWEAGVYNTLCPSDVLEEVTDCSTDANCTEYLVPASCQTPLEDAVFAKTLVVPVGYDTKEFEFTKGNFPTLVDGARYITVVVSFERNPDGRENTSYFSNRIVVKLSVGVLKPINIRFR